MGRTFIIANSLRFVGVALKTVDRYRRVAMTALAEVAVISGDTPGRLASVAIDAGFQAVGAGSNAATHGVIALMLKQIHMIAPHKSGIGDALTTTRGFDIRL